MNLEGRYCWFRSASECAKNAAPIFWRKKRWKWDGRCPTELDITHMLYLLFRTANYDCQPVTCGRLIYWNGRYGHEKIKG